MKKMEKVRVDGEVTMKHFGSQRFLISVLLILSISVSFTPASTVDAAMSFPTSGLIDNFILEMDRTYGYQILRPASWIASDLGDRREFTYSGSGDQMNRITLEITNLQVVSETLIGNNGLLLNYELFIKDPFIIPWMHKTEALWKSYGIQYRKIIELTDAMVFAIRPSPNQLHLIAYVVSQGQPLAIGLIGHGSFNDLENLKKIGLLADFETMVSSARAYPRRIVEPLLEINETTQTYLVESGPWHSDSGYRTIGVYTYRLQTDYYQAPPRVYWLYEYMHYGGDPYHDTWLYSTSVTDYPETTCVYRNSYLLWHVIEKVATRPTNTISDAYTPNEVVAHLNSTTTHMVIFGDPLFVNCQWYFPFTH